MADNVTFQTTVTATPPDATIVATDEVVTGGVGTQYQRVKLDVGGDGASVPVTQAAPLPIGTLPGGTVQAFGTTQVLGTTQPLAGSVHLASTLPGTVQVLGSIQAVGTSQVLGTIQPLAGSVHLASTLPGTVQALGSIQTVGTSQVLGSVQTVGTSQALGTIQPLAGSVHLATSLPGGTIVAVGSAVHGATADARPLLIGGFGSSGTQAAVADGQASRLWTDLNGRVQVRGTIDSIGTVQVLGSVQTVGTSQVLGSVQTVGTSQALGTIQPLAGSVHVANVAAVLGSVSAQGYSAHDSAMVGNPVLFAGYGSSGTQAASHDGSITRVWTDLNGRLQVRGTIDSLPNVTVTSVGGTVQVLGSVQTVGTSQVLGSVQTVGTSQALGTLAVQGLVAHDGVGAGNPLMAGGQASRARPGTVADADSVRAWYDQHGRQVVQVGAGTTEPHGTVFTGAGANGTILTGRGAGSYMRIFDIMISGSGGGTVQILENTTTRWGPLFIANNGGWNMNSAVGMKLPTANSSLVLSFTAGTWSYTMNYTVEGA